MVPVADRGASAGLLVFIQVPLLQLVLKFGDGLAHRVVLAPRAFEREGSSGACVRGQAIQMA